LLASFFSNFSFFLFQKAFNTNRKLGWEPWDNQRFLIIKGYIVFPNSAKIPGKTTSKGITGPLVGVKNFLPRGNAGAKNTLTVEQ